MRLLPRFVVKLCGVGLLIVCYLRRPSIIRHVCVFENKQEYQIKFVQFLLLVLLLHFCWVYMRVDVLCCKQDRECTTNVTLRLVRVTTVAEDRQ
jgi:hypothetical protein